MAPQIGPFKTRETARASLHSGKWRFEEIEFARLGYPKPVIVKRLGGWYIVFTRNGKLEPSIA